MPGASEAEFTRFAVERHSALLRLAWALTGDRQLGEDLAQESLQRLWRNWSRVSAAGDPWPYLQRVTVSIASNWRTRRRYRTREVLGGKFQDSGDATAADGVDASDQIDRWLMHLPLRQRAAVVLRYLCDLSVEDTAAVLDCSPGTVKSQTARALTTLRVLSANSSTSSVGGAHDE